MTPAVPAVLFNVLREESLPYAHTDYQEGI